MSWSFIRPLQLCFWYTPRMYFWKYDNLRNTENIHGKCPHQIFEKGRFQNHTLCYNQLAKFNCLRKIILLFARESLQEMRKCVVGLLYFNKRVSSSNSGQFLNLFYLALALYLPYVQGLFTITNNENFTTCTCSNIQ